MVKRAKSSSKNLIFDISTKYDPIKSILIKVAFHIKVTNWMSSKMPHKIPLTTMIASSIYPHCLLYFIRLFHRRKDWNILVFF